MGEVNNETLDEAALLEKRKSNQESEVEDGGGRPKKPKTDSVTETGTLNAAPEAKGEAHGNEEEGEEGKDSEEVGEGGEAEEEEEEDGDSEISEEGEEGTDDCIGKGITKLDKGKGILEVEEESDSDDCSDDDSDASDEDSDLSEDSLLEVDLNNILPSRTRRHVTPHSPSIPVTEFDNDSDSDDSDA